MITKDQKTVVIENNRLHDTDTGSPSGRLRVWKIFSRRPSSARWTPSAWVLRS